MFNLYTPTQTGITIGDYVTHKQYTYYGKLKVKGINFGTVELERDNGSVIYYNISELVHWDEDFGTADVKEDPLYCGCSKTEAKIVESSIQVQGNVNSSDKFKFCRTCKKEAK
jgi:hypothetical protein